MGYMEYYEYNQKNRGGAPAQDSQMYNYNRPPSTTSSSTTHHSSSLSMMYGGYPKIGDQPSSLIPPPTAARPHPSSSSSTTPGIGIRVALKPQFRITPPPQLSPLIGDIPRSNFQFDFEFERRILAEADKETPNWSSFVIENPPPKAAQPSPSGSTTDHVVRKYIASGLSREAVPHAVANYGDNPIKVREFANGYTLLREMGFSSNSVAEALLMYNNDTDKALAHFLTNSS